MQGKTALAVTERGSRGQRGTKLGPWGREKEEIKEERVVERRGLLYHRLDSPGALFTLSANFRF